MKWLLPAGGAVLDFADWFPQAQQEATHSNKAIELRTRWVFDVDKILEEEFKEDWRVWYMPEGVKGGQLHKCGYSLDLTDWWKKQKTGILVDVSGVRPAAQWLGTWIFSIPGGVRRKLAHLTVRDRRLTERACPPRNVPLGVPHQAEPRGRKADAQSH